MSIYGEADVGAAPMSAPQPSNTGGMSSMGGGKVSGGGAANIITLAKENKITLLTWYEVTICLRRQ